MTTLKQRAPLQAKRLGRRFSVAVGQYTASARMTPDVILVGAQRCGTTSLFRALMAHPKILPPVHHKGVNYFDVNYHRGMDWYRGHFPVIPAARLRTGFGPAPITFEASGYYSFHPLAAARLAKDLPDVKIMMMLRDPVQRAYSAYQHEFARGFETETFERALELEDERVEPDTARMIADPSFQGFSHRHHAYRRRGHYAEQLQVFVDLLGADRLLVVESTQFFQEPAEEFRRVTDFLGVEPFTPERFDVFNSRPRQKMSDAVREQLSEYFEPHDRALGELLGRKPSWRT